MEDTEERFDRVCVSLQVAPNIVLPTQRGMTAANRGDPERRLLVAMLTEACLHLTEAEAWFFDDTFDDVFSFPGLCHALGFDVDYWRRAIRLALEQRRAFQLNIRRGSGQRTSVNVHRRRRSRAA